MLGNLFKRLQHFDAYPKPLEDFRVKTLSGAVITVICTVSIILLSIYEYRSYSKIDVEQELFVDLTRNQKLTINLNVTFAHLPCDLMSVDAMDVSGEHQNDVVKGLRKIRLNSKGEIVEEKKDQETSTKTSSTLQSSNETAVGEPLCKSCYGAEASNIKVINSLNKSIMSYIYSFLVL